MEDTVAKQMVFDIMSSRVAALDLDTCRVGDGDAFIVADMGDIYRKHMDWKTHLGRVKPHYGKWLRFASRIRSLNIVSREVCTKLAGSPFAG